jgi:anti-sigma B factor antagonist
MDFTTTQHKRCDVIKAKGRIDSYTAPELEDALNKVLEKGRYNIVFDTSEITFVSSAGWWALIRVQKTCKGRTLNPGEVVLVALDPKIRESMDLVGITSFFKIFDDVTGAVGQF